MLILEFTDDRHSSPLSSSKRFLFYRRGRTMRILTCLCPLIPNVKLWSACAKLFLIQVDVLLWWQAFSWGSLHSRTVCTSSPFFLTLNGVNIRKVCRQSKSIAAPKCQMPFDTARHTWMSSNKSTVIRTDGISKQNCCHLDIQIHRKKTLSPGDIFRELDQTTMFLFIKRY